MATLQKITPHLWFDKEARKAAEFYVSVFPDSKITRVNEIKNTPSGTVDVVSFNLSGQAFMAIGAGPLFKFNESVSFIIQCETQQEIDYYWNKLTEGGQEQACGWLKDKFGLSWQVVPAAMSEMMGKGSPEQIARVTAAFMGMKKFDLAALQKAFEG
jgi:predicted 3-demethylubiquinone-9 3-methyltransferase (glyoxalase superfamily)